MYPRDAGWRWPDQPRRCRYSELARPARWARAPGVAVRSRWAAALAASWLPAKVQPNPTEEPPWAASAAARSAEAERKPSGWVWAEGPAEEGWRGRAERCWE